MREFSHYCLGNIEGCIEPSGAECNNTMSRCSECEISGLIEYSTVQYSTVQYSTVQYSTVQYSRSDPDTQTDWQSFHFPDNKLTEFGSLVIIVKI